MPRHGFKTISCCHQTAFYHLERNCGARNSLTVDPFHGRANKHKVLLTEILHLLSGSMYEFTVVQLCGEHNAEFTLTDVLSFVLQVHELVEGVLQRC